MNDTNPLRDRRRRVGRDPFAKGHYVNEVEVRVNPDRIRLCYSDAAWARLHALRQQYDPQGVFHTYLGQT